MIIDANELNTLLQDTMLKASRISNEYQNYLYTAYSAGLRKIEIFELYERTTLINNELMQIRTAKTNAIRTINITDIANNYISRILSNQQAIKRITYNQINRMLRQNGLNNIRVNGKKTETTHLFRHNKAKQLYMYEQDEEKVAEYFAITIAVARGYIYSIIEN